MNTLRAERKAKRESLSDKEKTAIREKCNAKRKSQAGKNMPGKRGGKRQK